MELSGILQNKIIEFLKSLPNIGDTKSRRAFIYSMALDSELNDQISVDEPPAHFVPLLVSVLIDYGGLKGGRHPLEVVLKTAKDYIGHDKKQYCDHLIQELQTNIEQNSIHDHIPSPRYKTVIELLNSSNQQHLQKIFPYSFAQFPQCLFHENIFDVGIIVGSNTRGTDRETEKFRQEEIQFEMFGKKFSASRDISRVPVTDFISTAELTLFLGFQYSKLCKKNHIQYPDAQKSICFKDIAVPQEILQRNLILVGGAGVNIYVLFASLAFNDQFGVPLPIRFRGDKNNGHFTCDRIISELSGQSYSRKDDTGFMHSGYLLMTANPWAPKKIMLLGVGVRTTGTAATLLALRQQYDCIATQCEEQQKMYDPWHELSHNNKFYSNIPGKVVRAKKAHVMKGQKIFQDMKEEDEFDNQRLPRRFIITDFEFLE